MGTMEEVEFDYEAHTRDNPPDLSKFRPAPEVRQERREAFKARLINHINMEIKHAREMKHVLSLIVMRTKLLLIVSAKLLPHTTFTSGWTGTI